MNTVGEKQGSGSTLFSKPGTPVDTPGIFLAAPCLLQGLRDSLPAADTPAAFSGLAAKKVPPALEMGSSTI